MVPPAKTSRGRRGARRVPHAALITYRLEGQEYGNLSADVSAEGMFIRSFVPPPVGSNIEVVVQIPEHLGGGRLELGGEVVRVVVDHPDPRQNGMGVKFNSINHGDAAAVQYLLGRLFDLR